MRAQWNADTLLRGRAVKKIILLIAGMLLSNFAFGDTPQSCPQAMAGKKSCISGEQMLCNKEFDPKVNDFKYEWHAVNVSGQTFDIFSPFYKKIPGYTPAACPDAKSDAGNKSHS